MGPRSVASTLPQDLLPQMRALAETVWRLVRRDRSQSAVHLISRVLGELDLSGQEAKAQSKEQRAYLLNLRGVILAQRGQHDESLADLLSAHRELSHWPVPLYNLGLAYKHTRRWSEAAEMLEQASAALRLKTGRLASVLGQGTGLQRAISWNLGIALTAVGRIAAAREAFQACSAAVSRTSGGDLGLAQLSLPTQGPYSIERVWVQRIDPVRARILSVVRYGAPCQFGDVVLVDNSSYQTGYSDGLQSNEAEEGEAEESQNGLVFLDALESAGYVLHVVQGGPATPGQAMALTERMREAGLHIEVWSLTMRLPGGAQNSTEPATDERGAPLCAGLVLPMGISGTSGTRWPETESPISHLQGTPVAEHAVSALNQASTELAVPLYAPTLLAAAGDELGAARHRKALRRGAGSR